jgi:site-specific DNA-methyltransferase (adenine-specific)
MLYQTDKPPMNDNRYQAQFEYMFVLSKGKPKTVNLILENTLNPGGKRGTYRQASGDLKQAFHRKPTGNTKVKGCIWYYASGGNDLGHPAVYPEQLAHDHIYSWSNEGDTVLDCFAGSGTTLKMAKVLSRHYIGIEISQEYISLAEKRLLATNVPLFGQGRGLTPREPDNGDSAPSQAFSQPEFLSDLEGLS